MKKGNAVSSKASFFKIEETVWYFKFDQSSARTFSATASAVMPNSLYSRS